MPNLPTNPAAEALTRLIAALFEAPSTPVTVIAALAVLIFAIGVAGSLLLTAKNGRMNISIGSPSNSPDAKDP